MSPRKTHQVHVRNDPIAIEQVLLEEEQLLLKSWSEEPEQPPPDDPVAASDGAQGTKDPAERPGPTTNGPSETDSNSDDPQYRPHQPEHRDLYAALHKRPRTALCLSGGGIRSATFSLGVLQGLAQVKALQRLDFLSTVSGGGFIGSWLSRWIHESGGIDKVSPSLAATNADVGPIRNLREFSNYLSPKRGVSGDGATLAAIVIRNLMLNWLVLIPMLLAILMLPRFSVAAFGQFDLGLNSGWALLAFVVFWYVIRQWLYASRQVVQTVAGLVVPLFVAFVVASFWEPLRSLSGCTGPIDSACSVAGLSYVVLSVPALLFGFVFVYGLIQGVFGSFISGQARERSSRESAALLSLGAGWLVLFAIVLLGPWVLLDLVREGWGWVAGVGGLAGAGTLLFGFFGRGGDSAKTSDTAPTWRKKLKRNLLPIVALVFLLLLATGLSLATSWAVIPDTETAYPETKHTGTPKERLLNWFQGVDQFLGLPNDPSDNESKQDPDELIMQDAARPVKIREVRRALEDFPGPAQDWQVYIDRLGNIHEQSLRPTTSKRLSIAIIVCLFMSMGLSALFGANRFSLHSMYCNRLIRAYLASARIRKPRNPDPYTGFDDDDNIDLAKLQEELPQRPLHIINATLNLAGGSDLSRQNRKGESFSFSPIYSGSESTKFVRTREFAGSDGISLGRAMAISGAAVSPAMGYHSSALVGAVLTLFNARLGWWLPNPKHATRQDPRRREPYVGLFPIVREFLGRANADNDFVHVSDGGHFENLGLYEMVRRRCGYIIVVDAGQDADNEFESLSTAIRMIRVDFGIDVSFDPDDGPMSDRDLTKHYSVGRIGYSAVDDGAKDGVIVYIRPVLLGDEPIDVAHYAAMRRKAGVKFPQETTADQFFDEAQFESYRKLGLASVLALQADLPEDRPDLYDIPVPDHPLTPRTVKPEVGAQRGPIVEVPQKNEAPTGGLDGLLNSFSSNAANWVAPAVASTIAASAVVALTVTVVGPESIPLAAPEEPLKLDVNLSGASLSVANLKELKDTLEQLNVSLDSETLNSLNAGIGINGADLQELRDALSQVKVGVDDATLERLAAGIAIDLTDLDELRETLTQLEVGVDSETLNRLAEGVGINQQDLDTLRETIQQLSEADVPAKLDGIRGSLDSNLGTVNSSIGTVNSSIGTVNDSINNVDRRLEGLRNDSGNPQ